MLDSVDPDADFGIGREPDSEGAAAADSESAGSDADDCAAELADGFGRRREADSVAVRSLIAAREAGFAAVFEADAGVSSESSGSEADKCAAELAGSLGTRRQPESRAVGSLMDARDAEPAAVFGADAGVGSESTGSEADDRAAELPESFGTRCEPESETVGSLMDAREAEPAAVFDVDAGVRSESSGSVAEDCAAELADGFGRRCELDAEIGSMMGPREMVVVEVFAEGFAAVSDVAVFVEARDVAAEAIFSPGRDPESDVFGAAAHEPVVEVDFAAGALRKPVSDVVDAASRARDPDGPATDVDAVVGLAPAFVEAPARGPGIPKPAGEAGCCAGAAAEGSNN